MKDNRLCLMHGIQTIKLGCGGTIISTLKFPQKDFAGIAFTPKERFEKQMDSPMDDCSIGNEHKTIDGTTTDNIVPLLQIVTDNPKSLDVLITRLTEARDDLINSKGEGEL